MDFDNEMMMSFAGMPMDFVGTGVAFVRYSTGLFDKNMWHNGEEHDGVLWIDLLVLRVLLRLLGGHIGWLLLELLLVMIEIVVGRLLM